jgi:hypothetical protein
LAVDPNDLLIFKMRGKVAPPEKKPAQMQQIQQTTISQPVQPTPPIQQTQQKEASFAKKPEQQQPVQNLQQASTLKIGTTIAEEKLKKPENAKQPAFESGSSIDNLIGMRQLAYTNEQSTKLQHNVKKSSKIEKESIELAKGLVCVNHPWRPAYAICNYCKRPFCYADLVEYNGAFYCLEDIDKVAGKEEYKSEKLNSFTIMSSTFFLANSVLLAYFVYPQTTFILNYIQKVGFSSFLSALTYSYSISFINTLLIAFGVIGGLLVFGRKSRWFYISWSIAAGILLIVSYEYLTTNFYYLLAISVIAFINIGTLAYSRMSVATEKATEESIQEMKWARAETF